MTWTQVCTTEDLVENSGICVLLNGQQIAIFYLLLQGQHQLFALGNYDPIAGANVMSRGIPGSVGDRLVVASPLYKQQFCLQSGQCLQQPELQLPRFAVKLQDGQVLLCAKAITTDQRASAA